MNAYKIQYANGTFKIVCAKTSLEVIKDYHLATREHTKTTILQLDGEQKAIALDNRQQTLCECGLGCDYERTMYEKANNLGCSNSRT